MIRNNYVESWNWIMIIQFTYFKNRKGHGTQKLTNWLKIQPFFRISRSVHLILQLGKNLKRRLAATVQSAAGSILKVKSVNIQFHFYPWFYPRFYDYLFILRLRPGIEFEQSLDAMISDNLSFSNHVDSIFFCYQGIFYIHICVFVC